jgi:hypothetical protein
MVKYESEKKMRIGKEERRKQCIQTRIRSKWKRGEGKVIKEEVK